MRLLVLCLLCGASLAATRRYLSVSMDELLMSSKAHLDCPSLEEVRYRRSNLLSGSPSFIWELANSIKSF